MKIEDCKTRPQFLEFLNQPAEALASVTMKELVQKAIDLGFEPVVLADAFQVPTGTLGRWESGKVEPHDIMLSANMNVLREMLAPVRA